MEEFWSEEGSVNSGGANEDGLHEMGSNPFRIVVMRTPPPPPPPRVPNRELHVRTHSEFSFSSKWITFLVIVNFCHIVNCEVERIPFFLPFFSLRDFEIFGFPMSTYSLESTIIE